jgi:hypothetical protein
MLGDLIADPTAAPQSLRQSFVILSPLNPAGRVADKGNK